jgi:hypothetical protein
MGSGWRKKLKLSKTQTYMYLYDPCTTKIVTMLKLYLSNQSCLCINSPNLERPWNPMPPISYFP